MITVNVYTDKDVVNEIFVSGHASYDVKGKDIVCSAVSTAVMLSANLVERVCPKYLFESDEDKVQIRLKIIESNEMSNIVMENLVRCLEDISETYGKYIKIKFMK